MHKLVAQEEVDSSSFPSGSKALFPATSNQQVSISTGLLKPFSLDR